MNTLPIYNTEGKEIDKINLDPKVFDGKVNNSVLYQVVLNYRANQRRGYASTKTRGEVSGGGRKPWRQKGTGRARVGSIRSPLWRGGGVVFGPHPRDYSYRLPHKIKLLALRSSLNVKLKENNIVVLDDIKIDKPKTKEIITILSNLKSQIGNLSEPKLLLLDKNDKTLRLITNNIKFLKINLAKDTHAYEILRARKVIITKEGLKQLTDRF